jgi:polar amino acid transport system ATP-binding protein
MSDTKILKVEDIHKRFGDNEILKGITFEMDRGETKVIIGSSGAGKSSLLRCINQLTPPDRGRVWLDGEEVTHHKKSISSFRQRMGMVFQEFNLFDHLSALGNVMIGLTRVKGMSKAEARVRAVHELDRVGLADRAELYPAELSGGQKQRTSIARALAMDPDLILFDEPTSALDPELIGEVLEVIKKLADGGMTLLIVTHEIGFARSVADEIIFLEAGTILEQGPPEELFLRPKYPRTKQFLHKITELYGD